MTPLRKIRVAQNLTSKDIANILGVTVSAVSKIERGRTQLHASQLIKLCCALQVSADDLIGVRKEYRV